MRVRATAPIAVAACALAFAPGAAAAWKHLPSPGSARRSAVSPRVAVRRAARAFEKQPAQAPKRDLSPLLRRVALDLPRLRGATRRSAERLLPRPTDGS